MILYTSGSTGQPKGVLRTQACTLRSAMRDINSFHLCAEDRESLLAKFSFGASVSNTFGALLCGALLLPFDVAKDGFAALARWVVEERITILKATPTVFRNLVRVLGEEPLPAIRILALGSETIQPSDVELFRKCCPADSLLRIVFSATELGSCATRIFLDRHTELPGNVVPAGYPTEDVEIALVDEDGNEVEPGQVGEIIVKGPHMALGYWRRPDLTAKVFAADPRGKGLRIYRTGDLGRMLPDGCLVLLGRRDYQTKVRGYRTDTAEIEKALLAVSGFSNVAVVARDDGSRRQATGRLSRCGGESAADGQPIESATQREASGLHGPERVRLPAAAADDRQRQGGSRGAAGTGWHASCARCGLRGAAHADRGDAGRPFGRRCCAFRPWA